MTFMNTKTNNGFRILLLACAMVSSLGCTIYNNLETRPKWAFNAGAEIPATHPKHAKYPTDQYMTLVAEGEGQGVAAARDSCAANAKSSFSKQVFVKVMAKSSSESVLVSTSDSKGGEQRGRDLFKETINTVTATFLSAMKAIEIWDEGFVIDEKSKVKTNYVYGAYVIEREVAARQALKHCRDCLASIQTVLSSPNINATTAIDGLRDVLELRLAGRTATFFGKKPPQPAKLGSWKQKFKRIVMNEGARIERTGRGEDLEEALAYYETCEKLDPDGGWKGLMLRVKRKLPCLLCGGKKDCTNCNGTGGFDNDCTVCGGTKIARPKCPKCTGSGQGLCPRCNGKRAIKVPCQPIIQCPTCKGGGILVEVCDKCNGTARIVQRNPDGSTYEEDCGFCEATGQQTKTCWRCAGKKKIRCNRCGGTGKRNESCPKCNAQGRFGDCTRCLGNGQIEERCNNCKPNGKVWAKCKECKGSKKCKICKGKGYRS
jgi:DnaJ-class molecular chaperone